MVKLGDIFEITSSKRVHQKDWREEGIPFYRAREVAVLSREGKVDNDLFIDEAMYEEYKVKFGAPEEGDILITAVGTLGLTYAVQKGEKLYFKDASVIKLRKKIDVDISYIQYAIASPVVQRFIQNSSGATVGTYTISRARETEIPLPPLDEQKRIAAILDKADAIRRKRQQAIQLADDFLRSVFLDMFGDPVTNPKGFPVSKLGANCEDLFLGLTSKVDYVDGTNGFPLIRAKDINKGELSFKEVKFISEIQHKKLTKNHLTQKGDLLVSKSGTLGTCAIVRTDREFSTYESIFTVRPNTENVNLHYLIHLLQNKGFKEKLIGNKVGGTVAHLNLKMFRDFEIGIPPINTQNEFSKKIIKCEQNLDKYKESILEADNFFNSISQKAFAGEL
jgi:type I restriction enzyme S subunit